MTGITGEVDQAVGPDTTVHAWVPSTLTTVAGGGPAGALYTAHGVGPGDLVVFGGGVAPRPGALAGMLTINYPTYLAGYSYSALTSYMDCLRRDLSVTPGVLVLELNSGCETVSRTLVLIAVSSTGGAPAYFHVPNVQQVPGTVNATGSWETGSMFSAAFSNAPPSVVGMETNWYGETWGQIYTYAPGSGGSGSAASRGPTVSGPMTAGATLNGTGTYDLTIHQAATSTVTVDAASALPLVVDTTFTPGTRTFSWNLTVGTGVPDITTLHAQVDDATIGPVDWTIYAPGDPGAIMLADLPAALLALDLANSRITVLDFFQFEVEGADHHALYADFDLYRPTRAFWPFPHYRPTVRVQMSGGLVP